MNPVSVHLALCWLAFSHALPPAVYPWDLERFPSYEVCVSRVTQGEQFADWLKLKSVVDPGNADFWLSLETQVRHGLDAWYDLRSATCWAEGWDGDTRLECLRNLRSSLGVEAYHTGSMPELVPWWAYPYFPSTWAEGQESK